MSTKKSSLALPIIASSKRPAGSLEYGQTVASNGYHRRNLIPGKRVSMTTTTRRTICCATTNGRRPQLGSVDGQWQPHLEPRAGFQIARRQRAAVCLHEPGGDGKAEPRAAWQRRVGSWHPVVRPPVGHVEHPGQVGLIDTDPGVVDARPRAVLVAPQCQLDFAPLWRVRDR